MMERIDRLIIKAREKAEPRLKPWEKAMLNNIYVGRSQEELLELLSSPQDDWRQIVQAYAWRGGD